ncbi:MAG: HAMP domain-containing histidine kinase [Nitrospirae bacterium]|nr:HAMP domain-containing histidine kinase [Nitrospirota bacterium]
MSLDDLTALESRRIQDVNREFPEVLTAGIAHEIKNAHAIILKGIELMENTESHDIRRYALKFMKEAVCRADRITRNLFTASIESLPRKESVDFQTVLEETLAIASPLLNANHISIDISLLSDMPKVIFDPDQLKQVLINLLNNASESMDNAGTITIRASKVLNNEGEAMVRIRIADTGHGISEKDKAKVFDPYYSTKKQSGGMGLGLFVVKNIVEDHKGSIRIESAAGEGTRVILDLPCQGRDYDKEIDAYR